MNNKFIGLFIFAAGAVTGSILTWKFTKNMYERLAQEEIDSVKEAFANYYNSKEESSDNDTESENEEDSEPSDDKSKLKNVVKNLNYSSPENEEDEEMKGGNPNMEVSDTPIIIRPEELGEIYDYGIVSLTYYADGVVADDWGNVLEKDDIESLITSDALEHFGEYEDDSVFVRNHTTKTDYEITKDLSNYYSDVEDEDSEV